MPTLTSLTVNLRGDSSSLVKATRTGLQSIRSLSAGIGRTVLRVGGLAAAVSGLAGGAGLLALGRASAKNVDAIGKLSTQLGVTGTDVQKLGLVADLSGVQTESLVKAMQRITRLTGDAGAGSKEAAKLFERLGLSVDDVTKASPVDRFRMVVGALNKLKDATQKASIGNKLFEEQWQRLNPLLVGFEANFSRAGAVFDTMGFGIGNSAGKVEALNDHLSTMQAMLVGFRDLVFSKVTPGIEEMARKVGQLAEAWILANGGAGKLADTLISEVTKAASLAGEKLQTLMTIGKGVGVVFDVITGFLKGLGTAQGGIVATAGALLEGNFAGAGRIISDVPGDVWRAAGLGGDADGNDPQLRESERQTDLLRDIVRNGATGGLVF